jgi:hypothetical protein
MRPNSKYQQSLVRWGFHGDDVIVYSVAKGKTIVSFICSWFCRFFVPPVWHNTVDLVT